MPHPDKRLPADGNTESEEVIHYLAAGESRARQLDNRGPIRFNADGSLHQDITSAYWEHGFYVFEQVLDDSELQDIEADIDFIKAHLPVSKDAKVDASGQPALGADAKAPTLFWAKPLADPVGGTDLANGRHPAKMTEPTPPAGAPDELVYMILGSLQFSDACLRLYGHPQLLAVAAQINGEDFAPFNEALFIKEPRLGASVAWHQDGTTHWDSPDFDEGCHGFNFMAQLYGCTAANGVWVVPGTHKHARVDIRAMVEEAGSDRLPAAVPIICGPGDVAMCNRQVLHGSFANTSDDPRVTINFGFHRRASVLGVTGADITNNHSVYDAARIAERSKLIAYAIDARHQRFPHETPYRYQPLADSAQRYRWDPSMRENLKDYNLLDLRI